MIINDKMQKIKKTIEGEVSIYKRNSKEKTLMQALKYHCAFF